MEQTIAALVLVSRGFLSSYMTIPTTAGTELWLLLSLLPSTGKKDLTTITNVLLMSSVDYCNVPYERLTWEWKLQLVQNTTAQMLTGASGVGHITSVLRDCTGSQ